MRRAVTLAIITGINLINYMDRYSVAGVLLKIQDFYGINGAQSGLMTTVFIISYMLFSPLFGYLGDRKSRKVIIACGIAFWTISSLASSFIGPDHFYIFLFTRALIGVGEASYSTIAPTILADLYEGNRRTTALSVYYFAVPVGSGLGYIIGAKVAEFLGNWQWALRVTPVFLLVLMLLMIIFMVDPPRGGVGSQLKATSWREDIKYLFKQRAYWFTTFGVTSVAFVVGSLALWAPVYVYYSSVIQGHLASDATISLIFGVITCVSGILGVIVGSTAAKFLRKITLLADCYICAFGLIVGGPSLFLALTLSEYSVVAAFITIFLAETLMFLNWALVSDMLLTLILPTRRSTANAMQILISHLLGDAGSPILLGMISDYIKFSDGRIGIIEDYRSLEYSLFITCFASVLGGAAFLFAGFFYEEDCAKTAKIVEENGYEPIPGIEEDFVKGGK